MRAGIIQVAAMAVSLTAAAAVPGRGQGVRGILPDPVFYANEVFRLTNIARVAANPRARPLIRNAALDDAATGWSGAMAAGDFLGHVPPGVPPTAKNIADAIRQRLIAAGYNPRRWGENVAEDYDNPQDLVDAFMDSPVHRVNIVNRKYKDLGIGIVFLPDGDSFVTQNFGTLRRTRRRQPGPDASLVTPDASVLCKSPDA